MKACLDTNVVISGIFFTGVPAKLLELWNDERFTIVITPLILLEYRRVAEEMTSKSKGPSSREIVDQVLDLITVGSEIIEDRLVHGSLCRDADDDKFLICAATVGAILVSGDKDLLAADGSLGVSVRTPREFLKLIVR